MVGSLGVGGDNPIRIQSMTTTPTDDTDATIKQTLSLVEAGCEIVRITAPTIIDARNLENIKNGLIKRGCVVPLVADIHFRPDAAMEAANFVEKVRINPGNFVDSKAFKVRDYSDAEYSAELARIEEKFTPLVLKLKKLKRALRIGTNHGSLSDRIMNRYGDTPLGMVESALEFLKICVKNEYHDVIFSMKASNPRVMIAAYRLLAARLDAEGWDYPFHLGVTEAGYGEDGRIKSAIGIGSLLEDGIGDTIRVSLTEDPVREIPVAREIANRYSFRKPLTLSLPRTVEWGEGLFQRRPSAKIEWGPMTLGGDSPIRVVSRVSLEKMTANQVLAIMEDRLKKDTPPEILYISISSREDEALLAQLKTQLDKVPSQVAVIAECSLDSQRDVENLWADALAVDVSLSGPHNQFDRILQACMHLNKGLLLISSNIECLMPPLARARQEKLSVAIGLKGIESVHLWRELMNQLQVNGWNCPILLICGLPPLSSSIVLGSLLSDGIGDAIFPAHSSLSLDTLDFSYNLLQATGNRLTKTEFVSCPSCGRTLFDLQATTERIKEKTGHLKGVKIAIMGCIVNGPGEMADADFGYVGGGPGKINLYVGKTCLKKSIPEAIADEKLIELIKFHGKWKDPI